MTPKGTLEETGASSGPASPTQAPQRGPEQSYHVAWEAAGGLWAKRPLQWESGSREIQNPGIPEAESTHGLRSAPPP